jgi:hypothetical protein
MRSETQDVRLVLKLGVRALVRQEVRLLRLETGLAPPIVIHQITQSIDETKEEIASLARSLAQQERESLLKGMIRETIDEEIDNAIALRQKGCVRCAHRRFYDDQGKAHVALPRETEPEGIGCEVVQPGLRETCRRFVQVSTASSVEDYLHEITLLYQFRDVLDEIKRLWEDYLIGP